MWAIAGFLCLAAIAGVMIATTASCLIGLSIGTGTWCSPGLMAISGVPIAVVCALVAGLPAYLLFRRLHFTSWWHYALGGLLIAVPGWYLMAMPFSSPRWQSAGFFDSLNYLGSGLCAGVVFYFLVRMQSVHRASNVGGAP